jgi:hypothetical protein
VARPRIGATELNQLRGKLAVKEQIWSGRLLALA